MKMSDTLFNDLKADCTAVCTYKGFSPADLTTGAAAWDVFHKVSRDRSYDDAHPGFSGGTWERILPCTRKPGEPFIDRFYRDEDLNDTHIATALRRIFPAAKVGK